MSHEIVFDILRPTSSPMRPSRVRVAHVRKLLVVLLVSISGWPSPSTVAAQPACDNDIQKDVHISLDNTGVGTNGAINPRSPFPLVQPERSKPRGFNVDSCYAELQKVTLVLDNLTDRFIGVQFSVTLQVGSQWESQVRDIGLRAEIAHSSSKIDDAEAAQIDNWVDQCGDSLKTFNPLETDLRPCSNGSAGLQGIVDKMNARAEFDDFIQEISKFNERHQSIAARSKDGLRKVCKYDNNARTLQCTPKIIVPPNASQAIDGKFLDLLNKKSATFTVSFENSPDIPTNSTGYLKTSTLTEESPDSTKWQIAAQIGASLDPDTNEKFFTVDPASASPPFPDKSLQHFTGAGSFKLDQRLGNRAAATATLGFKQGDLGEIDTSNIVKVPEYRIQLFGDNNLQLLFGKYKLSAPTDGISVNVVGEGAELQAFSFSLGHLIRRESANGKADLFDRDNSLFIAQLKNASLSWMDFASRWEALHTVSLVGLYGHEESASLLLPKPVLGVDGSFPFQNPPTDPDHCKQPDDGKTDKLCYAYHYWTFGGEINFGFSPRDAGNLGVPPTHGWSGSLGAYYSQRDLEQQAHENTGGRVRDGRGVTGLFKLNHSNFLGDGKPHYSLGGQLGYGSGDKPNDEVDDGYIGESTTFAPDQIFISSFANKIGALGGPSGQEKIITVGPGLSNKSYGNGTFIWNTWSPLAWFANIIGIEETPNSQSMTFKVHYYRFNEPRFGEHEAGWEGNVSFLVEVPKGITTTLDVGYFVPGDALPEVPGNVWRIAAAVKATI